MSNILRSLKEAKQKKGTPNQKDIEAVVSAELAKLEDNEQVDLEEKKTKKKSKDDEEKGTLVTFVEVD